MIFNLLEANCPLGGSIDSMTMETLMFCHPKSNRGSVADIPRGDRGFLSLGEEIHEETNLVA